MSRIAIPAAAVVTLLTTTLALLAAPCAAAAAADAARVSETRNSEESSPLLAMRDPALPDSARPERILFWPVPVETTFVVAPRLDRRDRLALRSIFATLIEVDPARAPGADAGELLERSSGLTVRRYGGPGAPALLSIRGANPAEVEVFLDRTPLRTAAQGYVDLSTLDLAQIEAIEVYRSMPPTDLGGEVAGSAVRLVTRSGGTRNTTLRASGGSFGTMQLEALTAGALRDLHYFLSASRFRTDGDFLYFNDNGTEHEPSDDSWKHWTNGDATRDVVFGKLGLMLSGSCRLEWSGQFLQRDQGIAGTSHQPTEQVRLATDAQLHRVEWTSGENLLSPFTSSLYAFTERTERLYEDPLRELPITGTPQEVDQHHERQGLGIAARWDGLPTSSAVGAHSLEILGELRDERLRNAPPPGYPEEDRRERQAQVLSVGDNWTALGGRLRLSAFYRWEESRDNYTGANPFRPFSVQTEHRCSQRGARGGARLLLGRGHSLKSNAARQARNPTFTELFGYGGTIQGNPQLAPETGWRWDAGWVWEPGQLPGGIALRTEQVYYESKLEQMIVFVTVSNRETKPLNLDAARIRGYELTLIADRIPLLRDLRLLPAIEKGAARLLGLARADGSQDDPGMVDDRSMQGDPGTQGASLSFNLNWQDARDEGLSPVYHGKQLTYHPPLQLSARLDLAQGRWALGYTAQFRAAAYWGRSNLPEYKTEDQWRHDLLLRCHLKWQRIAASLRIENLTDRELADVRGYPLPGRSWFGGLEVRI